MVSVLAEDRSYVMDAPDQRAYSHLKSTIDQAGTWCEHLLAKDYPERSAVLARGRSAVTGGRPGHWPTRHTLDAVTWHDIHVAAEQGDTISSRTDR